MKKQDSQMSDHWTMNNIPVLSTVHVPESFQSDFKDGYGLVFAPYTHGAFVFLSDESKNFLPVEYHPLCDYASKINPFGDGSWLRLDCDGDQYDELPVFDW